MENSPNAHLPARAFISIHTQLPRIKKERTPTKLTTYFSPSLAHSSRTRAQAREREKKRASSFTSPHISRSETRTKRRRPNLRPAADSPCRPCTVLHPVPSVSCVCLSRAAGHNRDRESVRVSVCRAQSRRVCRPVSSACMTPSAPSHLSAPRAVQQKKIPAAVRVLNYSVRALSLSVHRPSPTSVPPYIRPYTCVPFVRGPQR